eukprot:GFYU01011566.1.p1 GENE.GFYU01011566.1~~GFYU01011566.1.p1  ORF type:complete len:246 (-),score=74.87 GFYU01011566.1:270-1007(-)
MFPTSPLAAMVGRTVLITGSNQGIGLSLTKQYLASGDRVLACCRKASEELQTLQTQSPDSVKIIDGIDVSKDEVQSALKLHVGDEKLDIVINNAGVLTRDSVADLADTSAGFSETALHTFQVNSLGPLRVTGALLSNMKAGTKLALIGSRVGSVADNGSGKNYAYRMSKSAINNCGKSLSIELKDQGILVGIYHPGWVATNMTKKFGEAPVQPDDAAKQLHERIEELNDDKNGRFWHANGEELPW